MNPPTIDERLGLIADELLRNGITLEQACDAFERKYITVAIDQTRGVRKRRGMPNLTQASKKLGCHRNTLGNKLRALRTDEQIARAFSLMQRRRR